MESLRQNPAEEPKKPEQTGEQDTSKKRRKKSTKVLKKSIGKSIVTAEEKKAPEAPRRRLFTEVTVEQQTERPKAGKPETEEKKPAAGETSSADVAEPILPPLELPEVEPAEDKEFLGEIVIDHTEPATEKAADNSLETAPEVPVAAPEDAPSEASAEAARPAPEAAPAPEADTAEPAIEDEPEPESPPRVAPPFMFSIPAERLRPEPEATVSESAASPEPSRPLAEPLRHVEERLRAHRAEALVTEKEAHNREHRAEKRGLSRGVVAGGLTGWWLGRRGRKELSREAEATRAQLKERDQKIEALTRERQAEADTAKHRLSVIERTQAEMKKLMQRTWDRDVLKRAERPEVPLQTTRVVEVPVAPVPESAQPVFEPIKQAFKPVYRPFEAAPIAEGWSAPAAYKHEAPAPEAEKRPARAEAPPEEKPITEETYKAPEGSRIEMSSWHRIEVDEKTGKAVENPSAEYGDAFKRERRQEKLAADAAKAQTAAQVGMTLLYGGTEPTRTPLVPPAPASVPGQSPVRQSIGREAAQAVRQIARQSTNPLTWAAALVLVVLLFLTGVLR